MNGAGAGWDSRAVTGEVHSPSGGTYATRDLVTISRTLSQGWKLPIGAELYFSAGQAPSLLTSGSSSGSNYNAVIDHVCEVGCRLAAAAAEPAEEGQVHTSDAVGTEAGDIHASAPVGGLSDGSPGLLLGSGPMVEFDQISSSLKSLIVAPVRSKVASSGSGSSGTH